MDNIKLLNNIYIRLEKIEKEKKEKKNKRICIQIVVMQKLIRKM
jgi:hypothetical protein